MRKLLYLLPVYLMAAIILVSCNKDEEEDPNLTCYISQIQQDGKMVSSYEFTDNNRMTKQNLFDENGIAKGRKEHTYNASGDLTSINEYDTDDKLIHKLDIKYNNGRMINYDIYEFTGGQLNKTSYVNVAYNLNNLIQKESRYFTSGQPVSEVRYDYSGSNISKKSFYTHSGGEWKLSYTEDFQYDDKKNWEKLLGGSFPVSVNNPTKIVRKDASGTVTNETVYSYEYNAQGYPVKRNKTNAPTNSRIYSYNCK